MQSEILLLINDLLPPLPNEMVPVFVPSRNLLRAPPVRRVVEKDEAAQIQQRIAAMQYVIIIVLLLHCLDSLLQENARVARTAGAVAPRRALVDVPVDPEPAPPPQGTQRHSEDSLPLERSLVEGSAQEPAQYAFMRCTAYHACRPNCLSEQLHCVAACLA